ncbi:MAG TPA: MFS transporter [Acidimicrobiales bacterium]|nr:MFS transporter [Acidimicrobiales bacterium]
MDATTAPAPGAPPPHERHEKRWWTLAAVCGSTFMLLVDITIVQVALPTMQRTLHAGFSDLEWVISAYSLSLAALLLTQGSLADRFGRKRVFMAGVAIFTVSSLVCALSPNAAVLIAARAVQGVGGAGMFATGLALIGQDFVGRERGTAIAIWGATVGAAVAIGPLVGGALTSGLGWPWIFYVNLPVGAATLLIATTRMVNISDPGARRLDLGGLVTFSGSLFLLVLGLTRGADDGWTSGVILSCFAGAALLMAAFVVVELRQERPMFDLSLFRNPSFVGVSLGTLGIGTGMFAMFPYLTLYLQNVLGMSPLQGGLRMLPMTLLTFFVPLALRPVVERTGPGIALGTGLVLAAGGLALMRLVSVTSTWTALLPGMVVGGIGIGIANPAIARTALGVVEPARSGMASGINNTFRLGGVATGIAALGAIFQVRLASSLHASLSHVPRGLGSAVAAGGLRAASQVSGGNAAVVEAARRGFVSGIDQVFVVGAVCVLVGAFFAVLVRGRDFQAQPAGAPVLAPAEAAG